MAGPEQMFGAPSFEGGEPEKSKREEEVELKQEPSPEEWRENFLEAIGLIEKSLREDFTSEDVQRLSELRKTLGERVLDFLDEQVIYFWAMLGKYGKERDGKGKQILDISEIEESIAELKAMTKEDVESLFRKSDREIEDAEKASAYLYGKVGSFMAERAARMVIFERKRGEQPDMADRVLMAKIQLDEIKEEIRKLRDSGWTDEQILAKGREYEQWHA
jgi:hypothetical protein